jgi:ABC-type Fe3+/spermidine/putrescine transport system ATPase subunit
MAQVILRANDTAHLATLPPGSALKAGNYAALSVRPEDLMLTNVNQGHVDGVLEDTIFLGSMTRYMVRLADGIVAKVDSKLETSVRQGDTVGLYWEEACGVIVEEMV